MDVIVFDGPKHIQVRLQWIFNHHLRIITMAGITVIIAVGIRERNHEIIDLVQPPSTVCPLRRVTVTVFRSLR